MRTIGLIGGMSWESSVEYYRIINESVRARVGGLHSAKCILSSVDFAEVEAMQQTGQWQQSGKLLADIAVGLEHAGADCVLLCTNTMHKMADAIQTAIAIPFLHIADATGEEVCVQNIHTVGLLGTRFTMEEDFYRNRLTERFGLSVLIPPAEERQVVHRVIYDELVLGMINEPSQAAYRQTIQNLVERGAQGIILGCTEIGLLVKPDDSPVPLFDTTRIHAEAAVKWALS
jgi:aspartate racemase